MASKIKRSLSIGPSVAALLACLAAPLHAEPSGAERAAAESLFESATELMAAENFAAACQKFEGSLDLDPALGTMMRLGDCYDRIGKTASAWAMFRDAASVARNRNETAREQMATERAADLEKRLSLVRFKMDAAAGADLTVRVGSTKIPPAMFGAAVPFDPGPQVVEVSAPGRRSWSIPLQIAAGSSLQVVQVPKLKPAEASGPHSDRASGADKPRVAPPSGSGAQRTLGYVSGGLGVVALGAAGFLAYRARVINKRSLDHCRSEDSNACSAEGVSERQNAQNLARGAFVSLAGGGALLASGALLLLLLPSHDDKAADQSGLRVSASLGPAGGGLLLTNQW